MAKQYHHGMPGRPNYPGPVFSYNQLNPEQRMTQYDAHNPGSRNHPDPQVRLYGQCGCGTCAETRREWADNPSALDKPGRKGSGSMASVNLCDRKGCKSMVQGRALGMVVLVTASGPEAERSETEICPGCVKDVVNLLGSAPVTDREPAYRDPYKRPAPDDDTLDTATDEQLAASLFQRMMRKARAIEGKTTVVDDDTD